MAIVSVGSFEVNKLKKIDEQVLMNFQLFTDTFSRD